jgi:hypothetical protein
MQPFVANKSGLKRDAVRALCDKIVAVIYTGKLDRQLQTLIDMAEDRPNAPYPGGETFGPTPDSQPLVTPLSRFIHLQPIPFGTIMDIGERTQTKVFNVLEQHLRIIRACRARSAARSTAARPRRAPYLGWSTSRANSRAFSRTKRRDTITGTR